MNLTRLDPTRTGWLRKRLNAAIAARFNIFKKDLWQLVAKDNALGLQKEPSVVFNEDWRFLPNDRKAQELKKWLKYRLGLLFLKDQEGDSVQSWLGEYIKQSYNKGLKRAWDDWKRPTGTLRMKPEIGKAYQAGGEAEFMRQSFGGPITPDKLRTLATRAFTDLEGITDQLGTQITRTLIDGTVAGSNPRKIGAQLNKIVEGYKRRGTAIARTEVVRSFNEGALDGLESLGAKEIGIMVEWTTSGLGFTKKGNPSPCPKCAPLQGLVLKIEEARGLLPRHPNCMCSYIPANVGEKSEKQIRDAKRIRDAIKASAKGDPRWAGAAKVITR